MISGNPGPDRINPPVKITTGPGIHLNNHQQTQLCPNDLTLLMQEVNREGDYDLTPQAAPDSQFARECPKKTPLAIASYHQVKDVYLISVKINRQESNRIMAILVCPWQLSGTVLCLNLLIQVTILWDDQFFTH